MTAPNVHSSNRWFALSPFAVTFICATVQLFGGRIFGAWTWLPTMVVFWTLAGHIVRRFPVRAARRFQRSTRPIWLSCFAVAVGLLSVHGFLENGRLLSEPVLLAVWLVFGLINPWIEESYWRGVLMDATSSWGRLPSLLYSTFWFAISHPLIWGITCIPLRKVEAVLALGFVGLIWGIAYQATQSLRWNVAGHMLANLLGLAPLVLLNVIDPTIR